MLKQLKVRLNVLKVMRLSIYKLLVNTEGLEVSENTGITWKLYCASENWGHEYQNLDGSGVQYAEGNLLSMLHFTQ